MAQVTSTTPFCPDADIIKDFFPIFFSTDLDRKGCLCHFFVCLLINAINTFYKEILARI